MRSILSLSNIKRIIRINLFVIFVVVVVIITAVVVVIGRMMMIVVIVVIVIVTGADSNGEMAVTVAVGSHCYCRKFEKRLLREEMKTNNDGKAQCHTEMVGHRHNHKIKQIRFFFIFLFLFSESQNNLRSMCGYVDGSYHLHSIFHLKN